MSKLVWDDVGKKFYENGVQQGVLYPIQGDSTYSKGYAWNGLTAVTEKPTGAEAKASYADNIKYATLISTEDFGATIEAYTYPDEFGVCDGSVSIATGAAIGQQGRKIFGLSYKTNIGNDANSSLGYKLHLIYGALAAPSEKAYETVNDSPEAMKFSWEISTTPVSATGYKPTASITIDSTKVDPTKLAALENILYGTDGVDPRLPLPDEVATLLGGASPAALTMTISPLDDASSVATSSNVVLTFNNKIAHAGILVASAAGVKVEGTASWDTAGKVLTFHPTAALSTGTTYLVAITAVSDIYGQVLADDVKNFATTA